MSLDDSNQLANLALDAARSLSIAELHGAAVGLAVHGGERLNVEELVALLGADALEDAGSTELFIEATLAQLHSADLTFAPLLLAEEPSDFDAGAGELLGSAIADWCGAFLSGFACGFPAGANPSELAGAMAAEDAVAASLGSLPPEGVEIVEDLLAIAQLDTDITLSEDAETALVELEEYLKVGTLLLMSLLQSSSADEVVIEP